LVEKSIGRELINNLPRLEKKREGRFFSTRLSTRKGEKGVGSAFGKKVKGGKKK